MPRDARLYMTFPNDFWMHHKVAPLSDAAFRAFVEMNGYSRMNDLDGVIPGRYADFKWGVILSELTASDPVRPLVIHDTDADTYIIRDYAEHQQTTAARKALVEAKSVAGAKGAASRWHGKPMAGAMAKDGQSTETETDTSTPNGVEGTRKRATRIPDPFVVTASMRDWAIGEVPNIDVDRSTRQFVDYWRAASGRTSTKKDWIAAWRYWLRNERATAVAPKKSKAAQNAAEYGRLFGGHEGGVPAIDAGVS